MTKARDADLPTAQDVRGILALAPAQSHSASQLTDTLIQVAVDFELGRIGKPAYYAAKRAVEQAIEAREHAQGAAAQPVAWRYETASGRWAFLDQSWEPTDPHIYDHLQPLYAAPSSDGGGESRPAPIGPQASAQRRPQGLIGEAGVATSPSDLRSPAATTSGVCLDCGVVDDDDHAPGCSALARASRSPAETEGLSDEDETYEIGKRDGYEDAVQNIDLATGGDGEFRGSTIPGATVDVPAMEARILERFTQIRAQVEQLKGRVYTEICMNEKCPRGQGRSVEVRRPGLSNTSTVRECKCQPLTRYTDSPHDPECPLSDAPQERQPE